MTINDFTIYLFALLILKILIKLGFFILLDIEYLNKKTNWKNSLEE